MILFTLLVALARSPVQQGPPAPTPAKTEELCALGRLWGEVKFVHPWLYSRDIDWDAALMAAIPTAIDARGPQEFRAAVEELLAALDDPITRLVEPAPLEASSVLRPGGTLERGGAGVLIRAPVSEQGAVVLWGFARDPEEPPPAGVLFDLRGAVDPDAVKTYRAAFEGALARLIHGKIRMPSWRHVKHSGYPPEHGQTSGGYTREFVTTPPAWLEGRAEKEIPLVFVVDEGLRGIEDHLLALQLAGAARILLEGEHEDLDGRESDAAIVRFDLPHGLTAEIRASERIGPGGEVGFRPDLHLRPGPDSGAALQQARAVLRGELVLERPVHETVSRELRYRPELPYAGGGPVDLEHRMLGLFRYWCTIDAFQPYLDLLDRPWDDVLADFVPRFLAAGDDSDYQLTVAELAARTQDGHSFTISPALMREFGVSVPKVALRFVEDEPVVVAILDPAIEGVSVGDVLRSVEGSPVGERIARVSPWFAHSTPQCLHDRLRDVLLGGAEGTVVHASFEGPRGIRECSLTRAVDYVQGTRSTPAYGMLPSGHGYIDLERLQLEQVPAAFEAIAAAPDLVFDMRGYPNGTAQAVATRLGEGNAPVAAVFHRNEIGAEAPGVHSSLRFEQRVPRRKEGVPSYDGPVVVLIDERAISQAEHMCLFLEAAARKITFIGTPTNGTNGDITNSVLPGGIAFGFSGHDVRHADESRLQRRGIQPDILVAPTIEGLRAGRDEVLERAIRFLESGK